MALDVARENNIKTAMKHTSLSLRYCILGAERTAEGGCGQFYETMGGGEEERN